MERNDIEITAQEKQKRLRVSSLLLPFILCLDGSIQRRNNECETWQRMCAEPHITYSPCVFPLHTCKTIQPFWLEYIYAWNECVHSNEINHWSVRKINVVRYLPCIPYTHTRWWYLIHIRKTKRISTWRTT